MPGTYSYSPSNIDQPCVDKMRFELGDTTFAPGELTGALCDEEYEAIINSTPNWKRAKIKCLEAILMKYAHQVNVSVDGLSYSFASRVDFWKKLYDDLKKQLSAGVPTANPLALNGRLGGQPYFYNDMQTNTRKDLPSDYKRR